MVFHMKTTLIISDVVMRRLKAEAAQKHTTMSELVEAALRSYLRRPTSKSNKPVLPSFHGGRARVNISDRDALYDAMERT
jgi:hypothetical protein